MTIHYTNGEVAGKKTIFGNHSIAHKTPLRILIGFHGADSTPENMLIHGNKLKIENTLAVFPEGPVDAGEGLWSWWKDGPKQLESVKEFLDFASRAIEDSEKICPAKLRADRNPDLSLGLLSRRRRLAGLFFAWKSPYP